MGKAAHSIGLLWVVVIFLTACVQMGLSEKYRARIGPRNNLFLQRAKRETRPVRAELKVTDFHVRCTVVSRYAATTVESTVWNTLPVTKEAAFEVDLPSSAFISNFSITSNGKVYVAQVKERGVAKKIYDAAKKKGKTAGLVATKEREVEKFRVAVSVPSGTRLSFSLTYEELLSRRLGRYELALGLRPGQPVQNLSLEVTVAERSGISFIRVLPLRESRLLSNTVSGEVEPPPSTQVVQTPRCAHVSYTPTLQQQTSASPKGLNADFIIQYDVDLTDLMGDVQIYDGYFVHYFAPRGLPVVPKDVIFVIDISGSMIGTKIKQTKQAMTTILSDLREGDHFNIITFSGEVHTWKKGRTVQATRQNVREAKDFVKKIQANGWTNINSALLAAAQLVNPSLSAKGAPRESERRVPLVIFLTDGEATSGVTSGEAILRNAREAMGKASLFGLAFGDDADLPLLRRLALENRGVARTVYEDADAALQLKGFYDEVASPLLSDVQLSYLDDQAFDVTRALFPNYFQGSELVVAGRVKPGVQDLKVSLTATDSNNLLKLENDVPISSAGDNSTLLSCPGGAEGISSFVRRLWAYFTIKELLQTKQNSTDPATQRLLMEKATNLSLKYNFVTPVTSLVVVKPDADEVTPSSTASPSTTTVSATANTRTTTTTTRTTTTTTTSSTGATTPVSVHTSLSVSKTNPPNTAVTKKPTSTFSSPRKGKTKPDSGPVSKQPPPNPPSGLHTTGRPLQSPHSSRPSTTPSPGRTAASPSPKKTTPAPPGVIKTAPASLSGKTSAPPPSSVKTTLAPLSPSASSVKTVPPPTSGKTTTPAPISPKPATSSPTEKPSEPSPSPSQPENGTASPADIQHPELTTLILSPSSTPPDTDPETIEVATLIAATFAPMPGATDPPRLWEAAGLLDVSTVIQVETKALDLVKDYDANYDYDYDLRYDTTDDTDDYDDPQPGHHHTSHRTFSSSVDGDPHFVVHIPQSDQSLCFTVDGRANDVLRLLEDPEIGIIVDGHLTWAPSKEGFEDRSRTYFDQVTISAAKHGGMIVTVTMDSVVVEGEGLTRLPTDRPGSIERLGLRVTLDDHLRCWVELGRGLRFLILFHHYKHPNYLQIAHGLLGQFQHADMEILQTKSSLRGLARHAQETDAEHLAEGVLRIGEVRVTVSLQKKSLKDTIRKRHQSSCWVVSRGGLDAVLGHPYESYVVDHV
ncbi:hypothetical protein AGOR_G00130370 [Albula goreensis]|uniref:Inter-alpha-trypsin inhibitor heavy chain H6 n=1 Tax=Albula goreensis TaxID=1534307 RepID=A0A8T3D761_9TELE|nr:hypothetical protein AGOR_G00130370 [Albula goreensis]